MQSPYIKLFTKIRSHPFYPANRRFTIYEAWLDLILASHPTGCVSWSQCASRWNWPEYDISFFRAELVRKNLIGVEEDTAAIVNFDRWIGTHESKAEKEERARAKEEKEAFCRQVITAYNEVLNRSIHYSRERATQIWARHKSATKENPITVESFRNMFIHMKERWEKDEKMKDHLSIETLTRARHFQKYLEWARESAESKSKAKKENKLIFKPTVIE